jgi:predicted small secreted protein
MFRKNTPAIAAALLLVSLIFSACSTYQNSTKNVETAKSSPNYEAQPNSNATMSNAPSEAKERFSDEEQKTNGERYAETDDMFFHLKTPSPQD